LITIKRATWDKLAAAAKWLYTWATGASVEAETAETSAKKKGILANIGYGLSVAFATIMEGGFTIATVIATAAVWAFWTALTLGLVVVFVALVAVIVIIIKKMAEMGNWMEKIKDMVTVMKIVIGDAVSGIMEVFSAWGDQFGNKKGGLFETFTKFIMNATMYFMAFVAVAAFHALHLIDVLMGIPNAIGDFIGKVIEVGEGIYDWVTNIHNVVNVLGVVLLAVNPVLGVAILIANNWESIVGLMERAADLARDTAKKLDPTPETSYWGREEGIIPNLGQPSWLGGQAGRYITPQKMAAGGYLSGRRQGMVPTLVGERGPELFTPGRSGQIINTDNTRKILGSLWNQGKSIAEGRVSITVENLRVNTLVAKTSTAGKTRMNIDTMAG